MRVAERNRRIKKALAKVFGYKNVRVRGDRGTAYGWVEITVKVPRDPNKHPFEQEDEVKAMVWNILRETGLYDELYTYYDDMGEARKECIIDVELLD
ncbi:hypothetical protein DRP04_07965 [Archaeoglobales archaeon]|nr:MAG: hypothetical protein DRP04_07965 [Archaeoglobales archaeon]